MLSTLNRREINGAIRDLRGYKLRRIDGKESDVRLPVQWLRMRCAGAPDADPEIPFPSPAQHPLFLSLSQPLFLASLSNSAFVLTVLSISRIDLRYSLC